MEPSLLQITYQVDVMSFSGSPVCSCLHLVDFRFIIQEKTLEMVRSDDLKTHYKFVYK